MKCMVQYAAQIRYVILVPSPGATILVSYHTVKPVQPITDEYFMLESVRDDFAMMREYQDSSLEYGAGQYALLRTRLVIYSFFVIIWYSTRFPILFRVASLALCNRKIIVVTVKQPWRKTSHCWEWLSYGSIFMSIHYITTQHDFSFWYFCPFYTSIWKTDVLCCGNVRPSVRVFSTFFQPDLKYQFENWYMRLVCGTACRVWDSSQLGQFDLLHSQNKPS